MEPQAGPEPDAARSDRQRPYLAFLLRIWEAHQSGQLVWRASLENPHTGQRLGFAGLPELFAYLQAQAGSPAPDVPAPTTDG